MYTKINISSIFLKQSIDNVHIESKLVVELGNDCLLGLQIPFNPRHVFIYGIHVHVCQ